MQISISRDKYAGHARSPWLVVLPARLSPTGKRQYRRFSTRAAASGYVSAIRAQVKEHGEKPIAVLPARIAADAAAAAKLLEGSGLSLCDAVRQLLAAVASQGVACGAYLPSGGAGARGAASSAPAAASLTLPDILAKVEAAKGHQSLATKRARRGACHTLFTRNPGLSELPLESFTPDTIQAALDAAWHHSPTAWNGGRRQLHALFGYAIKRRLVSMENPCTCIEQRHVQESEITALPPEDLRKLFAAARPATAAEIALSAQHAHRRAGEDFTYLRPYIALCAFAGVRPTECTRLRWRDIDFEDAIISVRSRSSKTGGQRHIEMHPSLAAWLLAYRPPGANGEDLITSTKNLHSNLGALRRRAGFTAETPWQHDCLRHSYATYYLKAKCGNITQLQLNMGHRSAQLLYSRYVNMAGTTREIAESWWNILPEPPPGARGCGQ